MILYVVEEQLHTHFVMVFFSVWEAGKLPSTASIPWWETVSFPWWVPFTLVRDSELTLTGPLCWFSKMSFPSVSRQGLLRDAMSMFVISDASLWITIPAYENKWCKISFPTTGPEGRWKWMRLSFGVYLVIRWFIKIAKVAKIIKLDGTWKRVLVF